MIYFYLNVYEDFLLKDMLTRCVSIIIILFESYIIWTRKYFIVGCNLTLSRKFSSTPFLHELGPDSIFIVHR